MFRAISKAVRYSNHGTWCFSYRATLPVQSTMLSQNPIPTSGVGAMAPSPRRYLRHILIDCHESSLFGSRCRWEAWVKLSLCIATKNSAEYIELLRVGRSFADEVVVAVDASSNDLTREICRERRQGL